MFDTLIKLPVVPLRGLVVFPHTVTNFEVARDFSLKAVEAAIQGDGRIFLVAQRDMRKELPEREDVYNIGVVAKVRHILKLHGNSARVLVEGLFRAHTVTFEQGEMYTAEVAHCERSIPSDERADACTRALIEKYDELSQVSGKASKESIIALAELDSPAKLADTIAVNVMRRVEEKQGILDTLDVYERVDKVLLYLSKEMRIADFESEIESRTKEQIDKLQKEHYLREQMRAIQHTLGEDDTEELGFREKIEAMPIRQEQKEKLFRELARLERLNMQSPDYNVLRTYFEWVTELPWGVYTEDNEDLKLVAKVLDEDHYGMEKVKDRIVEYLAVRTLKKDMKGPILCFVGPPGVGKTSIAKSIARATGRKFVRMSLGGVHDEAEIRGHRRTYIGAIPGRVVANIKQAGTMNPLFLLDEIDKMASDFRGDPAAAMLEVLDPSINTSFQDNYLDIDFDLSKVMFVTTANDPSEIPEPLYDRMEIIELSSYTAIEKQQIAQKHLIPRQLEEHGINKNILKIRANAVREMIKSYTSESGVRSLERVIAKVCRKAARRYIEGEECMEVTAANLEEFLGAPKYTDTGLPKTLVPGVAPGLAWTSVGGTTMLIEVSILEGSGNIELTGQLGDVMKESAKTAISLVRSMADKLDISPEFYKDKDIHIHVPEGAVAKDGPSAGITMASALVSALTGKRLNKGIAMTGEITLTGRVLPIGGLKEKSIAAVRQGIKRILIPKANVKDLEEVPSEVKDKAEFVPVATFDDVLKEIF